MKVILLTDVRGTGKKDEIIEVSDGYGRNYLLPRKLAKEASATNLNAVRRQQEAQEHKKEVERQRAIELREKFGEYTVRVSVRAGENGRLFGAVTNQEVADALRAQYGVEIDRRKIILPAGVKQTGPCECEVKLYPEISAKLKLEIIAR